MKPGERIGKYEIVEVLGVGGQSIVYKCFDASLERFVAVKQIASQFMHDPKYVDQLRLTIRKVAQLGSKNDAIVTIYELIDGPDGLFYVMEFVEGHTLETLIGEADGPIEVKAFLLILFRLAAALHEVHSQGIVHRDIKPSNIILTPGLRPKIIDFGIAAFGEGDVSMPLATTKYLAPELYTRKEADGRADLYSLGIISYEMLLGREKFNEVFADVVADKQTEALRWMKWHGNEKVSAPSLASLNPDVPPALSDIVAALMEKDPAERFASTEELGRTIKLSFSPKRATASAPTTQPQGRVAQVISDLTQQPGIGTLEGQMEFQVGATAPMDLSALNGTEHLGPATAPLPQKMVTIFGRMIPSRTAWAAGIALFVLIFGGGGFLAYRAYQNAVIADAEIHSAVALSNEGKAFFADEAYQEALDKFQELRKRHPHARKARGAEVYVLECQAHLAIEAGDYAEAQKRENQANEAADTLQALFADDEVAMAFVRERKAAIEQLRNLRQASQVFVKAMRQAKEDLANVGRLADIDLIEQNLNRGLAASGSSLTKVQEAQVVAFKEQMAADRFRMEVQLLVKKADGLLAERSYDEADSVYKEALALFESDSVKAIDAAERKTLSKAIVTKRLTMKANLDQKAAYDKLASAEASGNNSEIRTAIGVLLKTDWLPQDKRTAYTKALADMDLEDAVAAMREAKDSNDRGLADAVKAVLALDSTHAEALSLQKALKTGQQRAAIVAAAGQAYLRADYVAALRLYREASGLETDAAVTDRILDCQYELSIKKARAQWKAKSYADAEQSFTDAKQHKPGNAAQIDAMLIEMRADQQYDAILVQVHAARKAQNWADALKLLDKLKQVKDTPEVEQLVKQVNYEKYLARGKDAFASQDWKNAIWSFETALKYVPSEEGKSWLKRAKERQGG